MPEKNGIGATQDTRIISNIIDEYVKFWIEIGISDKSYKICRC